MAADQQPVVAIEQDEKTGARKSPGAAVPATARGEATRRRILDAAEEVFGQSGYYEASVSEITRRAGVAQGTFYIYFRTKREIFAELVHHLGEQLRAAIRAAVSTSSNRLEVERRGMFAFLEFVAAHRQLYHIVQEAERVVPEAADDYYRRIAVGYERGLRAAMDAGEIAPGHAEGLAYALMGIAHFLALRWIIWPQQNEGAKHDGQSPSGVPQAALDTVLQFVERGLIGRASSDGGPAR